MSHIEKKLRTNNTNELDTTNEWDELIEGLKEARLKEINEIIK